MKKIRLCGIFLWSLAIGCTAWSAEQPVLDEGKLADKSNASIATHSSKPGLVDKKNVVSKEVHPSTLEKKGNQKKTAQSPYFYQATEQISEDLSVAFPIDI